MSISTRFELESAIMRWLNRLESDLDLVPFIPDFIDLAESEMRADLDTRVQVANSTLEELDGLETDLPADYGEVIGVWLYGDTNSDSVKEFELRFAHQKEIARMIRDRGFGGNPCFYWIDGKKINFFPQIDPATTAVGDRFQWGMTYRRHLSLGPGNSDTNDVLTTWPGIYLYGSLIHTAPFLEEDQRIQTWGSMYNELVKKANEDAIYSEAGTSQISMPNLY